MTLIQGRRCVMCATVKSPSAFYVTRGRYSGLSPRCRVCDCIRKNARKIGLNGGQYLAKYVALFAVQRGRCAICGTDKPERQNPARTRFCLAMITPLGGFAVCYAANAIELSGCLVTAQSG